MTTDAQEGRNQAAPIQQLGFPNILSPDAAIIAHALTQLSRHARLPPDGQAAISWRQRQLLLAHARQHSPFWRERLSALPAAPAPEDWSRIPILRRAEIQQAGSRLRALSPAMRQEPLSTARTSGSTGQPVTVERLVSAYRPLYQAASQLEKQWHAMDPRGARAVIRDLPDGVHRIRHPGLPEGQGAPVFVRNMMQHPPEDLLAWLREVKAPYLTTSASMAGRLARLALEDGGGPAISQVMSFGEVVTEEHRRLCREAFGARILDRYSTEEVGWIALQCPRHDHLHLLSSLIHLEIVDAAGAPCGPGQAGEVLITGLQSYAMPLIRYALGDMAEWGSGCDCGITLPVIRRILGRRRNFLRLPDGSERMVRLGGDRWQAVPAVREFRVVQYGDGVVEAFLRCAAPLGEEGRRAAAALLRDLLGHPFEVVITETAQIDWGRSYKREEFIRLETPWPGRPQAG